MDFHRVPNQVLYQAEPLPDTMEGKDDSESSWPLSGSADLGGARRSRSPVYKQSFRTEL